LGKGAGGRAIKTLWDYIQNQIGTKASPKKMAENIRLAKEIAQNTTNITKLLDIGMKALLTNINEGVQGIKKILEATPFLGGKKQTKEEKAFEARIRRKRAHNIPLTPEEVKKEAEYKAKVEKDKQSLVGRIGQKVGVVAKVVSLMYPLGPVLSAENLLDTVASSAPVSLDRVVQDGPKSQKSGQRVAPEDAGVSTKPVGPLSQAGSSVTNINHLYNDAAGTFNSMKKWQRLMSDTGTA